MFKKDLFIDDHSTTDGFNLQGGQKFYSEIRSSRNQYGRLDRVDNEVKTSTQYLPRTHYSSHSKDDFKISSCNHFQDLNEKFQELESKMYEVEKCFKEANKREMDEVQRLMDSKSETEGARNIPRSRLFEVDDNRKAKNTYPADGIKGWLGNHNSTVIEKKAFENRTARDGSGDSPQLPNKASSDDSCRTTIKTIEKSPVYLLNRNGAKGIFTLKQFDDKHKEPSKHYDLQENNKPTDVDFLEKSKRLILTLIDNELKKIETKSNHFSQSNVNQATKTLDREKNKNLKIECINNIERELNALKKLESLEQ